MVGDPGHSYDQWEDWKESGSYYQQGHQMQWPKSPKRQKGKGKKGKSPRPRHKKGDTKPDTPRTVDAPQQQTPGPPSVNLTGASWMQAAQQFGPAVPPANADASQTPASASGCVPPEYKGLIESLKRNQSKGTLPEDVQQEMKSLKVKVEKDQAKGLHQAVKSLSKARRELREAFDARAQLHAQWRSFLSLSVTQWQTFTDQFQAQEAAAMRQIGETQAALEEAKAQFEAGKSEIGKEETIADVDLVSEEENGKAESSAVKILDGLKHLTTSLSELSTAAESIHIEQQAHKKARLDGQDDVSGTPAPGSRQLEPFALPGTKRPTGAGAWGESPQLERPEHL